MFNKEICLLKSKKKFNFNILYYIAFFTYCLWQGLDATTYSSSVFSFQAHLAEQFLQIICILFLAIKIVSQKYSIKQILILCVILCMLLPSMLINGSKYLLWIFIFVAAGQNIKIKKISFVAFIAWTIVLLFTFLSVQLDFIATVAPWRSTTPFLRDSLGFSHPNRLGFVLFEISLSWLIFRFEKLKLYDLIIPCFSLLAIYFIADSRTSSIALLLTIIIFVFLHYTYKNQKINRMLLCLLSCASIVCVIANYACVVLFNNKNNLLVKIDDLITHRFSYAKYYLDHYSITLFGRNYDDAPVIQRTKIGSYIEEQRFLVDNAYWRILLAFGIIATIIFFTTIVLILVKAFVENSPCWIIAVVFICLIVGICERFLLDYSFTYILILASSILYKTSYNQMI